MSSWDQQKTPPWATSVQADDSSWTGWCADQGWSGQGQWEEPKESQDERRRTRQREDDKYKQWLVTELKRLEDADKNRQKRKALKDGTFQAQSAADRSAETPSLAVVDTLTLEAAVFPMGSGPGEFELREDGKLLVAHTLEGGRIFHVTQNTMTMADGGGENVHESGPSSSMADGGGEHVHEPGPVAAPTQAKKEEVKTEAQAGARRNVKKEMVVKEEELAQPVDHPKAKRSKPTGKAPPGEWICVQQMF